MKYYSYSVIGAHTAFVKLAKLSAGGTQQTKLARMMNNYPDSKERAEEIERKAHMYGL